MSVDDKKISVRAHLQELRMRLIVVAVFFVISFCAGFAVVQPLVKLLAGQIEAIGIELNLFKLTDSLRIHMQGAFVASMVLTLPLLFYQVWAFTKAGMTEEERRYSLVLVPGSLLLGIGGCLFSYYTVFPMSVGFMVKLGQGLEANLLYGMADYLSLLFTISAAICLIFQIPLFTVLLVKTGLLDVAFLIRTRKYAYLALVFVGIMITPADPISDFLVAGPLILLYELGIRVAVLASRKKGKLRFKRVLSMGGLVPRVEPPQLLAMAYGQPYDSWFNRVVRQLAIEDIASDHRAIGCTAFVILRRTEAVLYEHRKEGLLIRIVVSERMEQGVEAICWEQSHFLKAVEKAPVEVQFVDAQGNVLHNEVIDRAKYEACQQEVQSEQTA